MSYPPHVWAQLKNITCDELMKALEKDGWMRDEQHGSAVVYRRPNGRRVTVHYHPHKTYGRAMLSELFKDIGWGEGDFKRLKLIK